MPPTEPNANETARGAVPRWATIRRLLILLPLFMVLFTHDASAFQLFWIDDAGTQHEVTGANGTCPSQPRSRPVLFVHGHPPATQSGQSLQRNWVDGTSFNAAIMLPENQGLDIEDYYIEFAVANRSILEDANKIGEAIALIQACQSPASPASVKLAIIAYSKGTISTRTYLRARHMAGQSPAQDLSTVFPGDVPLTPHSPGVNPVSEFIAVASPNHGLRSVVATSLPIQQLNDGKRATFCTNFSDPRTTDFMSRLNGVNAAGDDWTGEHETPGNRANGAPVADGTLFVSLYDRHDFVGGDTPDGSDCTTPNRKQAFNRGMNAENIQLNVEPVDGQSSSLDVHVDTPKHPEIICRALYSVVHHRVPPSGAGDVCDVQNGSPIVPHGTGVVLALDHSGSMGIPSCQGCGTKQAVLSNAVEMFLSTWQALANAQDRVGITYFRTNLTEFTATNGETLVPLLPDTAALVADVQAEAATSSGLTAMGGAVQKGIADLQGITGQLRRIGPNRHVILFTDGLQNVNPKIEDNAGQQLVLQNAPGFVDAGIAVSLTDPLSSYGVTVDAIGIGVSPDSQTLLADLTTETGGQSHFSTDTNAINQFFTMTLVDTLRDASPQLIAYRRGTMSNDEQVEAFEVNAGAEQIVLRLSWTPGDTLDFRVEKAGVDLTGAGQWSGSGFFKIFTLDLPAAHGGAAVEAAGEWRMVIRGQPGTRYEAAAIVDEPQLDYRVSIIGGDHRVGGTLDLDVRMSVAGRPIDTARITARVERPIDSIGNVLADYPTPAAPAPIAFEPLTSAGQRAAITAMQDEKLWQRLQPTADTVELKSTGPGTYGGSFGETKVPGIYTVTFEIEAEDRALGTVRRSHSVSTRVRVAAADFDASTIRLRPVADTDRGREVALRLTPRDNLGNYFGPDRGRLIAVKGTAAKTKGTVRDLGNGTYEVPLILPVDGDPDITLSIAGADIFTGPISDLKPVVDEPPWLLYWLLWAVGWILALLLFLRYVVFRPAPSP